MKLEKDQVFLMMKNSQTFHSNQASNLTALGRTVISIGVVPIFSPSILIAVGIGVSILNDLNR